MDKYLLRKIKNCISHYLDSILYISPFSYSLWNEKSMPVITVLLTFNRTTSAPVLAKIRDEDASNYHCHWCPKPKHSSYYLNWVQNLVVQLNINILNNANCVFNSIWAVNQLHLHRFLSLRGIEIWGKGWYWVECWVIVIKVAFVNQKVCYRAT